MLRNSSSIASLINTWYEDQPFFEQMCFDTFQVGPFSLGSVCGGISSHLKKQHTQFKSPIWYLKGGSYAMATLCCGEDSKIFDRGSVNTICYTV